MSYSVTCTWTATYFACRTSPLARLGVTYTGPSFCRTSRTVARRFGSFSLLTLSVMARLLGSLARPATAVTAAGPVRLPSPRRLRVGSRQARTALSKITVHALMIAQLGYHVKE